METNARHVLIGAFTVLGFVAMAAFILWFGAAQSQRQFARYDLLLDSVSGISRGTEVRFAGLAVGQVQSIALDRSGSGKVRVKLELDSATPVRTGSLATLEAQGVTGTANVSISAGTPDQPLLADTVEGVPVIPAGRSTLQALTENAPALLDQAVAAMEQVNEILSAENRARMTSILANVDQASARLDRTLANADTAMAQVGEAIGALDGLTTTVNGLSADASRVMASADTAIKDLGTLKGRAEAVLDSAGRAIGSAETAVTEDLRPALKDLSATAESLRGSADAILPQARDALTTWTGTGERLTARLDETQALIASLTRSADAVNPATVAKLNGALDRVATDLPTITADLRGAASSAETAFVSLNDLTTRASKPLNDFLSNGLPQASRLLGDLRALTGSLNSLVTRLRSNPAGAILNSDKPEFRR